MIAVNRVGGSSVGTIPDEVRGYLITEKIEIDPKVVAAALTTTKCFAVERISRRKIVHGYGEMEALYRFVRHGVFAANQSLGRK